MESRLQFEAQLIMRNGLECQQKLKNAKIAIAGLGGLGSNIAVHLARTGVGTLLLVDFDTVELSNLNRQSYFLEHVGQPKPKALQSILLKINPYINLETQTVKICADNAAGIFNGYNYVCEALDGAEDKAMLVNTLLGHNHAINMVCGWGMAGTGSANAIATRKSFKNLYLCGDGESDASKGMLSTRVGLCAAHMAHMVLRLILGINKDNI